MKIELQVLKIKYSSVRKSATAEVKKVEIEAKASL